jgi:hypothetical protein
MKKLYIIGKFINSGKAGNDSSSLEKYTELGWELFSTGLWAKDNLTSKDYICTTKDRLFMYRHITNNLVPYEDLDKDKYDKVIDLTKNLHDLLRLYNDQTDWSSKEIRNKISRINFDFKNLKKLDIEKNSFVCIQIRNRDHCKHRNGDLNAWQDIVKNLSMKYEKVFIVGKALKFLPEISNVQYVNLEEYVYLISHKNCIASFGPESGCMLLNLIYGKKNLNVTIDFLRRKDILNHVLFFADRTNIAEVNLHFKTIKEILDNTK